MVNLHKYIHIALREILERVPSPEEVQRAELAVKASYPHAFDRCIFPRCNNAISNPKKEICYPNSVEKQNHSRRQVTNSSRKKNPPMNRCSNFHTFDLSKVDNYMGHPICPVCKTVCWTLNKAKGRR